MPENTIHCLLFHTFYPPHRFWRNDDLKDEKIGNGQVDDYYWKKDVMMDESNDDGEV